MHIHATSAPQGARTPKPYPAVDLRRIAATVFEAAPADEDALYGIAEAARSLVDDGEGDGAETTDLGFFLIAWSADRIAAQRIASGDLAIDEAPPADYQALADEILIDTLNEFRQFEMVVLYSGHRDGYARRCAEGLAVLAARFPAMAADSAGAVAEWCDGVAAGSPAAALAN